LSKIVDTVKRTGARISGPVLLPTKLRRYTVLRSPHVDKKSREQFEMRIHKRLLEIIDPTPKTVEGHVVIDGCLGDFFAAKYGNLAANPVSLDIRGGRAVKESVACLNEELKKDFLAYLFESDENSDRVGEFAIGTNTGLKGLIGNLLQDEKFPGIHIAFGDSYGNKTGASWSSKTHVDGVLRETTILVDGETIMSAGRFTL